MSPHTAHALNSLMLMRSSSLTRSTRSHSNVHKRIRARRNSCLLQSIEEVNAARIYRSMAQRPRSTPHQHRYVACGLCRRNHRLLTCFKYQNMSLRERYEAVMQYHYCINCLARSHLLAQCTSRQKCSICSGKHHSSLHGHPGQRPVVVRSESPLSVGRQAATITRLLADHSLMPTALVRLRHDGIWHSLRALINPTRKVSAIAASTTRQLRIPNTYVEPHLLCHVELGSRVDSAFRLLLCALVTKDLPSRPYERDIGQEAKNQFEHLTLADPNFTALNKVVLELGADVYPRIMRKGLIVTNDNTPVAQQTVFGWTLAGPYEAELYEAEHCEYKLN